MTTTKGWLIKLYSILLRFVKLINTPLTLSQKIKVRVKLNDEYGEIKELPAAVAAQQSGRIGAKKSLTGTEGNAESTSASGAANEESQMKVTGGNLYPNAPGMRCNQNEVLQFERFLH